MLGDPHTNGEISCNRRGASGAQRRAQKLVCGSQDRMRPTQMVHATAMGTQPEAGVHWCTWVWVLECGVWRADPGRGQLLAVRRQPEGTGVRSSTTRNAQGASPDPTTEAKHHC